MKRIAVILSVLGATVALAALMLPVASAAPSAPAQRVDFTKETSSSTPHVGEILTFTLRFSSASGETQAIYVRVADPNPAPAYLEILTPTITGGAWYSPTIDGVVWKGMVVPASGATAVTFQVQVTSMPAAAMTTGYPVTNTATMIDLAKPGSLPEQTAQAAIHIAPMRIFLPLVVRNYGG